MQKKLVFVVEDDPMLSRIMGRILEANGANFIIAHNLKDAMELFETNKMSISHILLDGSLTERLPGQILPLEAETLPLAKEIAKAEDFCGVVYPMSVILDYVEQLLTTLGNKGVFLGECNKIDVIKHVINEIKK